jgi:hypothetical protein
MRKKQPILKRKRVQTDKNTSVPPIGVPSWCLNEIALRKLNRTDRDIPIYDNSDDSDDENDNSDDERRRDESRERGNKKKRKKSSKKSKKKKSKK